MTAKKKEEKKKTEEEGGMRAINYIQKQNLRFALSLCYAI